MEELQRQSIMNSFWAFVSTCLAKEVEQAAVKSTHIRQVSAPVKSNAPLMVKFTHSRTKSVAFYDVADLT